MRLGDAIKFEYGKPLDQSKRKHDGLFPVYGANGEIDRTDEFLYAETSIIIGRKGSAGEVNLSAPRFWPLDVTYYVTFNDNKYDLKFLFYLLIGLDLPKLAKGVKPGLNRNEVYDIDVNIPPFPEQQRIVAILDESFDAITKAKENTEKNLQNTREIYESYLRSIFANPGEGWKEKKLGEVCEFIRGPFGGSLKKQIFVNDGYAVYEQSHAIYNQFTEIRYYIDDNKFNEMKRFELNPGNIIMSCSGTMGKTAIVPEGIKKGIINQALLILKPNKTIANKFIVLWMQSGSFQESLRAYSSGAAIQNVASVKILKEMKIQFPTLPEQIATVAKLDVFSVETQKLEAIYSQKLADLDELKKSILQKAFNGEL